MKTTLIATALLSLTLTVPVFAADGAQATDTQSKAVVLFEQGSSFFLDNKHEEAKKTFREAIAPSPNYVEAYDSLGKILVLQQKYDEAVKEFSKALELSSTDFTAYFNRGIALYHLGAYDSIRDFTEVIRVYPKNQAARHPRHCQVRPGEDRRDFAKSGQPMPGPTEKRPSQCAF